MTIPVESVLGARDPSINDENGWEEFNLTDVEVYQAGRKDYASILSASPDHPLVAIGKLNLTKQQELLVLDKKHASSYVIINNITHFAFGQNENGDTAVWIAGPPGWFLITPNNQYKMVYDASVEAVDLFYFVVDLCKTAKRRKKGSPSIDKLCAEYNKHIGNPYPTTADVAELFHKHHEFLMKQMNEGAEGVKWHKTLIYAYLSEHHPELARPLESFKKSSAKGKRASALAIRNSSSISDESLQARPGSSPLHYSGDIESGTQSPASEKNAKGKIQKSILRPRTSSKGSSKGTKDPLRAEKGDKKRLIGRSNADGDEDSSVSEASETPSRKSVSDACPDSLSSLPVRPKKKSRLAVISTTTDDTPTTSDTNRDISSAEDEQYLSAELPPDTWVCPVEGCPKLIYRASLRYAKDMISDHSLSHAHDTKGMLDLVFSEQRRNVNANVSHLIGRIREFAQNSAPVDKKEEIDLIAGDLTTKEDPALKSETIAEGYSLSTTEAEPDLQTTMPTIDSTQDGTDDMEIPLQNEEVEEERGIQRETTKNDDEGQKPKIKELPADG